MKRLPRSVLSLLLIFAVTGCSVEIQQTPLPTPRAHTQVVTLPPGQPASSLPIKRQVPMTWSHLNLAGRLVYVFTEFESYYAYTVQVLDLTSGQVATLFKAPDQAIIYDLAVSPDYQTLLLSYSLPAEATGISYRNLYSMPMDGSSPPQQLFPPAVEEDENYQAEWSPDGKYIYYTNFNYQTPPQENGISPLYTIYRMAYPNGAPEKIAENSLWPSLSPDSSKIVYVRYVGSSLQNVLYVAESDGSNPREVAISGSGGGILDVKDAPVFMPDGQSILFSSPITQQAYKPNMLDKLMGVQIARAHNVPSDWYLVPINGGEAVRLTRIEALGLFASISPDQDHIASLSGKGIFAMEPDGSNLTQLISDPGAQGAIRWIP